jgi:hypothetical protein
MDAFEHLHVPRPNVVIHHLIRAKPLSSPTSNVLRLVYLNWGHILLPEAPSPNVVRECFNVQNKYLDGALPGS